MKSVTLFIQSLALAFGILLLSSSGGSAEVNMTGMKGHITVYNQDETTTKNEFVDIGLGIRATTESRISVLVGNKEVEIDTRGVKLIKILTPVTHADRSKWPARFGNKAEIPTIRIELTYADGRVTQHTMYATYFVKYVTMQGQRKELNWCRVKEIVITDVGK